MLRHQLGQDLVLGLYLLLQELNLFLFLLRLAARTFRRLEGGRPILEELFLPSFILATSFWGVNARLCSKFRDRQALRLPSSKGCGVVTSVPSNVSGCEQTVKSKPDMVCAVPLRMLQVPRPELNRCSTRERSA
jgi:hypothetical protein